MWWNCPRYKAVYSWYKLRLARLSSGMTRQEELLLLPVLFKHALCFLCVIPINLLSLNNSRYFPWLIFGFYKFVKINWLRQNWFIFWVLFVLLWLWTFCLSQSCPLSLLVIQWHLIASDISAMEKSRSHLSVFTLSIATVE